MSKYVKKPVTISAIEFTGTTENLVELSELGLEPLIVDFSTPEGPRLRIETLEGNMYATVGDFIIRGIEGEFYPCKPKIFKNTYEKVVE